MVSSIIYAKVFGLFFVIVSLCMLLNGEKFRQRIVSMKAQSEGLIVGGFLELLLGLFVIATHNVWVQGWPVIITIIGYMMVCEATSMLACPQGLLSCYKKMTEGKRMCILGSLILLVGLFLIAAAFFNFKFCIKF